MTSRKGRIKIQKLQIICQSGLLHSLSPPSSLILLPLPLSYSSMERTTDCVLPIVPLTVPNKTQPWNGVDASPGCSMTREPTKRNKKEHVISNSQERRNTTHPPRPPRQKDTLVYHSASPSIMSQIRNSEPVYTDPEKNLNGQKLAKIRPSFTRDPRNLHGSV